jgi:hypothetical protein
MVEFLEAKVFMTSLLTLMKSVGKNEELKGLEKKQFVIDAMRTSLRLPDFLEDILAILIDTIIEVEDGKLVINEKIKEKVKEKVKKKFICF